MKQTVNLYDFRDAFNRMDRADAFSYEGLEILFNGLEELEDDTGEEMELDVIALCCDFSEMTLNEIIQAYPDLFDDDRLEDDDAYDYADAVIDYGLDEFLGDSLDDEDYYSDVMDYLRTLCRDLFGQYLIDIYGQTCSEE